MRVLIAGAGADSRRALESNLAAPAYEVVTASNATEARELLEKDKPPTLVILGMAKDGVKGAEVCRGIRKRQGQSYTFVLLLASKDRPQDVIEGIEAGADDYLFEPFDAYELRVRLRSARRILELQEEVQRAQETIGYQLHHDPLTGLWNRAAIIDILRRELSRAKREDAQVAVMVASLDGLKGINDTLGPTAGDHVVRITARRMRSSLRPYDAIGRYGGGEFLMVAPGCNPRSALKQAERLQACISARPIEMSPWAGFSETKEARMAVTISLGVTAGANENEAESLLRAAEGAADRARRMGTGRIEQGVIPQAAPPSA